MLTIWFENNNNNTFVTFVKFKHAKTIQTVCFLVMFCRRRYFGLTRNLIRRIISPNQDDLSYSTGPPFPGSRNWVSCQTQSLWVNNAVQCRRPRPFFNSRSRMDTWDNLSNLWIPCVYLRPRNPSWIWIRYIQYATTGTTLCHPQNWLCRCDSLFRSRHLALNSPLGHFNRDNARLSPKSTRHTKLTVTPKFISSNGKHGFR